MVCSPFSSLLLSQQFTNLAAVFAHCCLSPSRNGCFLSFVIFTNSRWVCVNCGKYVPLMSWYSGQVVRKCSSVSTTFSVQWVHNNNNNRPAYPQLKHNEEWIMVIIDCNNTV